MYRPREAGEEQKRLWRETRRFSSAEIAVAADQDAFHARRRRICAEAAG
jgi:hypothetical protein